MYAHLEKKSKIVHNLDLTKVRNKGALKAICFSKETFSFKVQNFGIKEYSNTGFITLFTKNLLHPKLNHIYKIFDDIENQVLDVIFENRYKWCNGMNIPRYHFEEAYHQPIKIKNNETYICCHFDSSIEQADLEQIFSSKKIVTFMLDYQGFELSESDIFPLFKLSQIIYKEIVYSNILTENSSSDDVTELSEMSCYQKIVDKKNYDIETEEKQQNIFLSQSKQIGKEISTDQKNSFSDNVISKVSTQTDNVLDESFSPVINSFLETKETDIEIENIKQDIDVSEKINNESILAEKEQKVESKDSNTNSHMDSSDESLDYEEFLKKYLSSISGSKIENIVPKNREPDTNSTRDKHVDSNFLLEFDKVLQEAHRMHQMNNSVKGMTKKSTSEKEKKREREKNDHINSKNSKENSKSMSNKSSKHTPANYVSNVEFLKIKKSQDLKNMYLETINNGYESQFEKAAKMKIKK